MKKSGDDNPVPENTKHFNMETSNFYSRSERGDIEDLENSFKPGKYFVERKSDNKWLVPFCHPDTLNEEHWTNDPTKAMSWRTKPLAELEIIRMKLGDSALVTEHEFVDPESTPVIEQKEPEDFESDLRHLVVGIDQSCQAKRFEDCRDSVTDRIRKFVKKYGQQPESKLLTPDGWISVKERLPDGGDEFTSEIVLGYNPERDAPEVTFYWKIAKHWKRIGDKITHWMPLPKTPQVK